MTSRSIFLLILKIFFTFLLMFLGQENISWDVLYFLIVITCNIGKTVSVTRKNICEKWSNDAVKTFQRQPSRAVLWKRCCENMQQIYRRTRIPKYDFNKVEKATFFSSLERKKGKFQICITAGIFFNGFNIYNMVSLSWNVLTTYYFTKTYGSNLSFDWSILFL